MKATKTGGAIVELTSGRVRFSVLTIPLYDI
jgi:hypothetical protein